MGLLTGVFIFRGALFGFVSTLSNSMNLLTGGLIFVCVCVGRGGGGIIECLPHRLIKCLNFAFHVVKQRRQPDNLVKPYANLY